MPNLIIRLAFCVSLAASSLACAAGPASYTGEAPVASQSDADRAGAMQIALGHVIVSQTGNSAVLARPDVGHAIGNAERYMLQYQYRRNSGGDTPLTLVVDFDSRAINNLLTRLGLGDTSEEGPGAVDTPSQANIWINGVHTADDYIRVIGYLGHNNFVQGARTVQAHGDGMLVHVSLATDLPQFIAALALERTLVVDNNVPHADGVDATLTLAP